MNWVDLYESGKSVREIAALECVHYLRVYRFLKSTGVTMRPMGKPKQPRPSHRICADCGRELPFTNEYYPKGRGTRCKWCANKRMWALLSPDRKRIAITKSAEWTKSHRERVNARVRERYAKDPAFRQQIKAATYRWRERKQGGNE